MIREPRKSKLAEMFNNVRDSIHKNKDKIIATLEKEWADTKQTNTGAGGRGFRKYIKPLLVGKYEPHNTLIDFDIQSQFSTGGFNCLNEKYVCEVLTDVFGLDQRSAYDWCLTQPLPYGEMLLEKPTDSTFIEYLVVEIDVEPLPQYDELKCIRVSVNKRDDDERVVLSQWVNSGVHTIYVMRERLEFFKTIYRFKKCKEIAHYYWKTDAYLKDAGLQYWHDRNNAVDKAQEREIKLIGVSMIGYLALSPYKENGVLKDKVPTIIAPIVDYTICGMTQLKTLNMIKRIIDAGGNWINSMTDSVYFNGVSDEFAQSLVGDGSFGSWGCAFDSKDLKADKFIAVHCNMYMAEKDNVRIHLRAAGDNKIEMFADMWKMSVDEFAHAKEFSQESQRCVFEMVDKDKKRTPVLSIEAIVQLWKSKGVYN